MNTPDTSPTNTTSPTMHHTTTTPTNAATLQTPSTENLVDAEFTNFADRVLAVIAIDQGKTASFKDMELLIDELTALCRSFGTQPVSWSAVGVFFLPIMLRIYDLTFRIKLSENTVLSLCQGQQELRKALRSGSPAAIVEALNRQTTAIERSANAAENIAESSLENANNTGNLYAAIECWGEAMSLSQAAAAGLLNEAGKDRLRSLLGL